MAYTSKYLLISQTTGRIRFNFVMQIDIIVLLVVTKG